MDAMAARFVLASESLDVVAASSLFADILTDLGGAICSSLGVSPGTNINPERRYRSMFEPVHGSAPDILGKGISNPIAMLWCGAMMLDFLGEGTAANPIMSPIKRVTGQGHVLTPDLGGRARTSGVTDAIIQEIRVLSGKL